MIILAILLIAILVYGMSKCILGRDNDDDELFLNDAVRKVEEKVHAACQASFFRDVIECQVTESSLGTHHYTNERFDNNSDTFSGGLTIAYGRKGWQRKLTHKLRKLHPEWSITYHDSYYANKAYWEISVMKNHG